MNFLVVTHHFKHMFYEHLLACAVYIFMHLRIYIMIIISKTELKQRHIAI